MAKNTTEQGNAFRDSVADLLRVMPGVGNLCVEAKVGSQDVDIYYEYGTLTGTHRVACECKDYGSPLTRTQLAEKIYPRYRPLLDNDLVDEVLVVAPMTLGAEANAYLKEVGFAFQTRDELEFGIMDFRSYLRGLSALPAEEGLASYYVPPRVGEGSDLREVIDHWLSGEDSRPVAILAGYGMGKSSFAKTLAGELASKRLAKKRCRIPILVRLAEISAEQALEGLIAKVLTAQARVANFSFELFMELNRRGKFLILLDGFDEMKHTMTWHDFRRNVEELHRLVVKNSKVVLLGRPSAFLSEAEELFVLRGIRVEGDFRRTIPGSPDYYQHRMLEFTNEQAAAFMRAYSEYRLQHDSAVRAQAVDKVLLNERLAAVERHSELAQLTRRPVQARMLADLALDPSVDWRNFSRFELYEEFLTSIADREARKAARQLLDKSQRMKFQEEVAWWAWSEAKDAGFSASEVPRKFREWLATLETENPQGLVRELLVGSVLERKSDDMYYFPHRSFMEFLVARGAADRANQPRQILKLAKLLTLEVSDFLMESKQEQVIAYWCDAISDLGGQVSARFLGLVAKARNRAGIERLRDLPSQATPRDVILEYLRLVDAGAPNSERITFLANGFHVLADAQAKLSVLLALLVLENASEGQDRENARLACVGLILIASLDEMKRISNQTGRRVGADARTNPVLRVFLQSFRAMPTDGGTVQIGMFGGKALTVILECLESKWILDDLVDDVSISFEAINLPSVAAQFPRLGLSKDGGAVMRFFKQHPEPAQLVLVRSSGDT